MYITTREVGIYKRKILRKEKKDNTLSTRKKERKQDLDQEKMKENTIMTKEIKVTKISTANKKASFKILLFFISKFRPQI